MPASLAAQTHASNSGSNVTTAAWPAGQPLSRRTAFEFLFDLAPSLLVFGAASVPIRTQHRVLVSATQPAKQIDRARVAARVSAAPPQEIPGGRVKTHTSSQSWLPLAEQGLEHVLGIEVRDDDKEITLAHLRIPEAYESPSSRLPLPLA